VDRTDRLVLQKLAEWQAAGRACSLVTVTKTWGTAPRPPGAMLAVATGGDFVGSVSGGCIEQDLVSRLIAQAPARPEKQAYGISGDQAARHGLPCGGQLEIVIEPVTSGDWARRLVSALSNREPVTRRLHLADGQVSLESGLTAPRLQCDADWMVVPLEPLWRMVIIGAGHLSAITATFARELGYDVTVCDPRRQYRDAWPVTGIDALPAMPDDLLRDMQPDGTTVVLALTHDPKFDDLALLEALESKAYYVGALGSSRTNASRRRRLQEHFGMSDAALARLHGPVGIDLNSRRAPEIALAIMTELTALKNGVEVSVRKIEAAGSNAGQMDHATA
jgi:xanthine dehydrogenase accessory factor